MPFLWATESEQYLTFFYVKCFRSLIQRVSGIPISQKNQRLYIILTESEFTSTFSVLCFIYVQPYYYLQVVRFSHGMPTLLLDFSPI
jgi:hypothetical protein